jgi:hypothetical protein
MCDARRGYDRAAGVLVGEDLMVSQTFASWNQMAAWLLAVEKLRGVA